MRRRLIGGLLALAALTGFWWFSRPTPGPSLFANWDPHAKGKVWSITGSPDSPRIVFVDPAGAFQPRKDSYSLHYYLYDRDSHHLCTARPTCRLAYGCLPTVELRCGGVTASYETFVSGGECVSVVSLRNGGRFRDFRSAALHSSPETPSTGVGFGTSVLPRSTQVPKHLRTPPRPSPRRGGGRRVSLFAVVLPYQLTGPMLGSAEVRYDGRTLTVGGRPLLTCDSAPTAGAAYGAGTGDAICDVTGYLRSGMLPRTRTARGGAREITSGAMRFDIDLEPGQVRRLVFQSPGPGERVVAPEARRYLVRRWEDRLGRVGLEVPDARVEECFRASSAYLVMLSRDGRLLPGPTKYGSFWVRDCAYMTDALYYSGQGDLLPPALAVLRSMQLPNGGFAARTGAVDNELDAPGEAIYALVQQYRRTGDRRWLAGQWECIERACRYVAAKRKDPTPALPSEGRGHGALRPHPSPLLQAREHGALRPHPSPLLQERGHGGILPASVSAEDLGKGDQQHYWDDFWCIRGLRDAAYAARELGKLRDATWIAAEAESLSRATRASIEAAMARHSIDYIPNGPDEVLSSSMARGTSCALWPCAALEPSDALVRRSFDVYWSKWIAPSDGGFIHREHFWPYAGMDLAQGYVMLGQRERAWKMLKWTLEHDPTRGFYSWPEGMFTDDLTLAEGDMPHGWMCAAYVSMARNMLVRESGRDLVLMSGVPKEWLKPGARIAIRDFPTEFGKVSFEAKVVGDVLELRISGARPAGVYRVELPGQTKVLARDARGARVALRG